MRAISYTAARETLAPTMKRVCEDRDPVVITRKGQPEVVMVCKEDYDAMEETAYLMRSPANLRRIFGAIQELESGAGVKRELVEE